ncbi:MFS transporter [Acetobacter peroxydans]|jgi:MFS family permease|uniref:MFS transporter n=1 Tax=Acetobacter peroxydans TaxID=104098 RepID=UPI00235219B2|nr:MFS transporter [Acetobacter peroxydans]MCH4143982.1 MFS transporter [Acetobacter peroxydans]MCI1411990.1 MFS transporter [Acetobacter peroxydans]MCI1567464.1 MFS transporter [Acetobacter peroxydans]MCI1725748.1 MFS transporter [Acetobacter peroxydans]
MPRAYFAGLSRNVILLAIASLFTDISTEMLYPVLPVFLTQILGASGSIVGLIDGCVQSAQNIAQGISGTLSDRLRQRKSIALVGYFLAAISKPLMGLSTSWMGLFGARMLDRLGTGTRSAPRDALIASSVDEKNRGRAFGFEGTGDNIGAFLGPLLAALLLSVSHVDIRSMFYFAFIPSLTAFCMVLFVKENTEAVSVKPRAGASAKHMPTIYWKYLLVTALFGIGCSSNAFLILRMQETGGSLEATILIYSAFNLVAALVSYPAGYLSDHWGRRTMLLVSFLVFLIAYLGFALSTNVILIGCLFVIYGVYQGIFRSIGKALAADLVATELRATGIGWYSATIGLFQLVASVIAGELWDHIGHAAVFYNGAIFAAVGIIGLQMLLPKGTGNK